jgi:hypothetical protein
MTPPDLQRLFGAVVQRHLTQGDWGLVAVAPVATLSDPLQLALARSFAVDSRALVLVFEPGRPGPQREVPR